MKDEPIFDELASRRVQLSPLVGELVLLRIDEGDGEDTNSRVDDVVKNRSNRQRRNGC